MTRQLDADLLLDEGTGHRWRLVARDEDPAAVVEDWMDVVTGEHRWRVSIAGEPLA